MRACALERVIQYSRDARELATRPQRTGHPAFAGYDGGVVRGAAALEDANRQKKKQKCEAAEAVEALDPGVPYESRWAPYDRIHGPGQGQFPKGSIRPRGYMAPDAQRSFAPPM